MDERRTAVVTGGGRGIGREICKKLAAKGYDIATCYASSAHAAQETEELCKELGAKTLSMKCDVGNEDEVKAFIEAVVKEFGRIDALVLNAGVTDDGLILRMSADSFKDVINTDLTGAFYCVREAARPMMKARYGRIVFIGSIVGEHGNAGQANYSAAKAGLIGLMRSTAKEFAKKGITANLIAPGFIETSMTASLPEDVKKKYESEIPVQRMGNPDDVAEAVSFFASEESSYITGQVLGVDGGMSA